ncbi:MULTISPECIES: DUF3718 domain-containing protein [Ferrimonas]|uniref:DUF3718 domain-containing protein n=1 Tax=Ferrimonas TaxID=44011 RepID=UPI0003F4DDF3|nr:MULTISPECIES: DUF3718 domain-containing protein [Ferrimonas]USD36779.1 DUF3718 domain-containing protein [Ferrimonas sp. SCSIO 43195]
MKALTLTAVTLAASLAIPAQAAQANMTAAMEQSLIATCKASLTDSKYRFNKTMKVFRVNPYRVLDKLVCNGQDIATFAENHGAPNNAEYIRDRYLPGQVTIQDIAMTSNRLEVWFEQ